MNPITTPKPQPFSCERCHWFACCVGGNFCGWRTTPKDKARYALKNNKRKATR
jgi:hypothetical protein